MTIVQQDDGRMVCEGDPPPFVVFHRTVVEILRRGGCLWASIDGDTITLRVCPEPLYYRLTGEAEDSGAGLVAQRMTADGRVW